MPSAGRWSWSDAASVPRRAWWRLLHALCWVWFKLCYRFRARDAANIPPEGPVIYLSNHQSFLDPIIVGLAAHRRAFHALARSTLFRGGVGWLIRSLNAIPVERGTADMTAIRRCLEVLRLGHALLLFPEGTRSPDGGVRPFATGTMLLIRRSGAAVLPVAIEGAQHAWPRHRKAPRLFGRIAVRYGKPIDARTLSALQPDEALELLRQRIEDMRQDLARSMPGSPPLDSTSASADTTCGPADTTPTTDTTPTPR